jgi:hypothetical protein
MTEHERQLLRAQETLAWVKTWHTWREDFNEHLALQVVLAALEADPSLLQHLQPSLKNGVARRVRFDLALAAINAARGAHPDGEAIRAEQIAVARAARLERRQRTLRLVREAFERLGKDSLSLVNLVAFLDRHDPSWGPRSEAMSPRCASLAFLLRQFGVQPQARYHAGRKLPSRYVTRSEVAAVPDLADPTPKEAAA